MDNKTLENSINSFWDSNIVPILTEYIKIPNKSPSFDPDWKKNGHMDKVLHLATNWTKKHLPSGASVTIKESKFFYTLRRQDIISKTIKIFKTFG